MKNKYKDYRTDYYALSGKASDVARQLAFAGIAVVWVFKQQEVAKVTLPEVLVLPALLFVVALALDLLQYVFATLIWGQLVQHYADKVGEDEVIETSKVRNWPALCCFWLKISFVFAGYGFLVSYFLSILKTV